MEPRFRVGIVPRGALQLILAGDQDFRRLIGGASGSSHHSLEVAAMHMPVGLDFGADQLHALGAGNYGGLEQSFGALICRQRFIPAGPQRLDQGEVLRRPFGRVILARLVGPQQPHQAARE